MASPYSFRSNPYQTRFVQNPYLQSVFEGIDLLVADTQAHNERQRAIEASNVQFERKKASENVSRKFGLLSGILGSKETFAPETKTGAVETLFKLVQDPNTDISQLDLKPYEAPPKEGRQVAEFTPQIFPQTKGKTYSMDVAEFFDREARMWLQKDKDGGSGSGKGEKTPRRKMLDEYRDEALKILHQGFTEEGFAGKAGLTPEIVSQFLNVIDDLRRKDDDKKWTDTEEQIFKSLKPLEVSGIGSRGQIQGLTGAILDAVERLRKLRE